MQLTVVSFQKCVALLSVTPTPNMWRLTRLFFAINYSTHPLCNSQSLLFSYIMLPYSGIPRESPTGSVLLMVQLMAKSLERQSCVINKHVIVTHTVLLCS